jgi:hypothetical protein
MRVGTDVSGDCGPIHRSIVEDEDVNVAKVLLLGSFDCGLDALGVGEVGGQSLDVDLFELVVLLHRHSWGLQSRLAICRGAVEDVAAHVVCSVEIIEAGAVV